MEALQRNINRRLQSLEAVVAGIDEEVSEDLPSTPTDPSASNEVR